MGKNEIEIFDFASCRSSKITVKDNHAGHGGGDSGLVRDLLLHLNDKSLELSSNLEASIQSHLMAFAADKSRLEGRIVQMNELS